MLSTFGSLIVSCLPAKPSYIFVSRGVSCVLLVPLLRPGLVLIRRFGKMGGLVSSSESSLETIKLDLSPAVKDLLSSLL